jgi:PEGA domain
MSGRSVQNNVLRGVLFAGGLAVAVVVARGRSSPQSPAASTVVIDIRTVPAGAKLVLDGQDVSNPYHAVVPAAATTHGLYAAFPGYAAIADHVVFTHSQEVVLKLEPEPPAAAKPTP